MKYVWIVRDYYGELEIFSTKKQLMETYKAAFAECKKEKIGTHCTDYYRKKEYEYENEEIEYSVFRMPVRHAKSSKKTRG